MYLAGHLGMALLLATPLVAVLGRRTRRAVALLAAATAMLPDIDLVLPGVQHHGVTHTLVFVVLIGLVSGFLGIGVLLALRRWTDRPLASEGYAFALAAGGVLLGGLSHLLADALTAPDVAQPIHPFWPVATSVVSVDVVPIGSSAWNVGMLVVGLGAVLAVDQLRGGESRSPSTRSG